MCVCGVASTVDRTEQQQSPLYIDICCASAFAVSAVAARLYSDAVCWVFRKKESDRERVCVPQQHSGDHIFVGGHLNVTALEPHTPIAVQIDWLSHIFTTYYNTHTIFISQSFRSSSACTHIQHNTMNRDISTLHFSLSLSISLFHTHPTPALHSITVLCVGTNPSD